jgi:protocatechuate 3,4-dioxygenase beta subunit
MHPLYQFCQISHKSSCLSRWTRVFHTFLFRFLLNLDGATESTIFGPFYREGASELPMGASISKDGRGEPVVVTGRVLSTDGSPIPDALLDVWETDENGLYEQQDPEQPEMNLRGKFSTDSEGRYCFVGSNPSPTLSQTMDRLGNCYEHLGVILSALPIFTCSFQQTVLRRSRLTCL